MKNIIEPGTEAGLDEDANFNLATTDGSLVFLSGQIAETEDGKILDSEPIEKQTRQCLQNLKTVLESEGLGLEHILKTRIYVVDIQGYDGVNKVYGEYFDRYPARTFVGVTGLFGGVDIEIEAIATTDNQ